MATQNLNLTRDQLATFLKNFEQIKQLEPQMEAGALREGAELARLQEAIASQTRLIEQIRDQILSGQERERSVSQIRSSLFWLQIWQLILLLTGGALVAVSAVGKKKYV